MKNIIIENLNSEHRALLYILNSVDGLKSRFNQIYDVDKNMLKLNYNQEDKCFDISELCLSSSESSLLRSAINLYNGNDPITLLESFSSLDNENKEILIDALRIRFNF